MRAGVLVPVHGFAPYLAETLDAILAQPGEPVVVVVDDGSPQPLALHPDHAPRVTLVRRETAGGPAVARQAGLDALPEDVGLVALCDADDAWLPGALARVAGALTAEPGAGWAFGRALVVGPNGRPTGERWAEPPAGRLAATDFGRELYAANPVPTSSVVLRRAALAEAGGFTGPVRVAEDWELWLRLCAGGVDAVCVGETTVRYRRHPGGLTADVAGLAAAQLAVHERHAELVGPRAADRVIADDHAALAAGLAREGRYAEARAAWAQVAARRPLRREEQVRRAVLALPGLRRRLGRGDPYRG
ncbi:glycosyltransferase [Paraconexibacter antarcticus]|uniref:Glycosyltransferase n=1 Tax=Paraconexibacter antarcticus TaxID=2949664 RepID=A0ABY5DS45_9ACTN|nr:glycosyltransferase [Paraconexibacter antarcticus]UTI64853.1 glycosyltransferase [Paraconexibacter antarcticus]